MFGVSIVVVCLALVIRFILYKQNREMDRAQGIAVAGDKDGEHGNTTDPAERGFRFLL
jgi:hypothetical protein